MSLSPKKKGSADTWVNLGSILLSGRTRPESSWQVVNSTGGLACVHAWGQAVYGESRQLLLNFAMNL